MRSRRALQWSAFSVTVLATAATRGVPVILGVDGRPLKPFEPAGAANVIFFIATDCPISNSYAPEIQRVSQEYGARGVGCSLMYEDVDMGSTATRLDNEVRRHLQEYRYADISAAVDRFTNHRETREGLRHATGRGHRSRG